MNDDRMTVDLETLLQVTRQKLVSAVVLNTELEAIISELQRRVDELEKVAKKENS